MSLESIVEILQKTETFIKEQPLFSGVVGVYILGVVTWILRSIPNKIKGLIIRYFTITITIENYDTIFYGVTKFLEKNKIAEKSRTLKANSGRYGGAEACQISTGYGKHFFWWKGRVFVLHRSKNESSHTEMVKETISISTYGRSQQPIRNILKECQKYMGSEEEDTALYQYYFGWHKIENLQKRSLETVIIDKNIQSKIINHIDFFLENNQFYLDKDIPYRTGILLSGPPGTGKTSLIKALAHYYGKNLYFLSIKNISDSTLQEAFRNIKPKSIIVIEDIDSLHAAVSRESDKDDFVSTSGLLNVIDGFHSSYGRILFMTSNYPENLDSALIRPGRCDLNIKLDYATSDIAERMFERFYGETTKISDLRSNMTTADLENIAISNLNSPEGYLRECVSIN